MLKGDRLSNLKSLFNRLKAEEKKKFNSPIQGQIIQILKTVSYFRAEADNYGTEVLLHYIPLIQPYILRAGMQIIGFQQQYVIIEGLIKGIKTNGELGNVFTDGMILEPSVQEKKTDNQKQVFYCIETTDTALIKIFRNSQDKKLHKFSQNLFKFQKQRTNKSRQNQIIMLSDKNLTACKENLKKYQFFANLGTYDINDIVIQSKLFLLSKGSPVHSFGEAVTKIGFLLSGQIKVDNSVLHQRYKAVQPGKLVLEKYMVHRKQKNSSVVSFIQPGEWIGLQQYLWSQDCFVSNAQIASHDAQILMIPTQVFEKRFNELTSYFLINKIKGLVETKKKLLQKTIKTKKQKQQQMMEQKQKAQAIQQFKQKLENHKNQSKRNSLILSHIINNNNTSRNKHNKTRDQSSYPKQCYMPERLIHKIKVFEQKYSSLPKIKQRLVLFPEEYEKAMIPLDLQQELKMVKNSRNKNQNKDNQIKPFRLLSSQKVYQTIIYNSLTPKNITPEKRIPRMRSKASIQFSQILFKNQLLQTMDDGEFSSRTHYNKSICNNFQAPKNRAQKFFQKLPKTLEII